MQVVHDLARAPAEKQVEVLVAFVEIVRGFGGLAEEIVEPSRFRALAEQILDGLGTSSPSVGVAVASTLEDLPFMKEMDEPKGLGSYASGAVVELIYAAWYLQGRPKSIEYAYTRMADLLDAADDELGTSMHSLLEATVQATLSGTGEAQWNHFVECCSDVAHRLSRADTQRRSEEARGAARRLCGGTRERRSVLRPAFGHAVSRDA